MKADERQRQILIRARADGRVEVGGLAADLAVAEETVRRDLRELVGRGVLQRVHGGAYPVESAGFETHARHRTASTRYRRSDGSRRRPPSGCTVPRRSSSTRGSPRSSSPRRCPGDRDHRGHGLAARRRRAGRDATTSPCCCWAGGCAGAPWRPSTTGPCGCSADLVIDLAFLGANGISREHGLTTPDPAVAAVKAPGRRSGPGAGSSSACTRSSARPASAGSPRSRTSRSWSPTPGCAATEARATPYSGRRWSGPDRTRPAPRPMSSNDRDTTTPGHLARLSTGGNSGDQIDENGSRWRWPCQQCAGLDVVRLRRRGRRRRRRGRRLQVHQRPDGRQPADGGHPEAHRGQLHQGHRHQGELHRAARRTSSGTRSPRTSPPRPVSTTSRPSAPTRCRSGPRTAGCTRWAATPTGDSSYDKADLLKPMVQSLSGEDGKLYGLPFYGESSFLMYRKDVLKPKGITMPERPTWHAGRRHRGQGRRRAARHEGHLPARPARLGRDVRPADHGGQHLRRHLVRARTGRRR